MDDTSNSVAGQPKPGPLKLLWRGVLGLFAVIGAVGSVITVEEYLSPPSDEQRIIDSASDHALAYRSRTFPMAVTVDSVVAGNEDLTQTEVTFWRDGGKPITADMTRRPLRVILPSGSHLVTYRVVGTNSSVPENFTVERNGDDLAVRWKVFDPDMAIKLALVRSGSSASVLVTSEVGPGVTLTGSRYTTTKWVGLLTVAVLAILLLALAFLVLLFAFFNISMKLDKRIPYSSLRTIVFLVGIVGIVFLQYQSFQYEVKAISWLEARTVKPIPLQ